MALFCFVLVVGINFKNRTLSCCYEIPANNPYVINVNFKCLLNLGTCLLFVFCLILSKLRYPNVRMSNNCLIKKMSRNDNHCTYSVLLRGSYRFY